MPVILDYLRDSGRRYTHDFLHAPCKFRQDIRCTTPTGRCNLAGIDPNSLPHDQQQLLRWYLEDRSRMYPTRRLLSNSNISRPRILCISMLLLLPNMCLLHIQCTPAILSALCTGPPHTWNTNHHSAHSIQHYIHSRWPHHCVAGRRHLLGSLDTRNLMQHQRTWNMYLPRSWYMPLERHLSGVCTCQRDRVNKLLHLDPTSRHYTCRLSPWNSPTASLNWPDKASIVRLGLPPAS
mmetsp:Transcript_27087/g.39870  ORF Transcript_27087/g.39870 Transcript_27087/m.39870 type:complete len:236 (-) Transcript_27087:1542-2249(-)